MLRHNITLNILKIISSGGQNVKSSFVLLHFYYFRFTFTFALNRFTPASPFALIVLSLNTNLIFEGIISCLIPSFISATVSQFPSNLSVILRFTTICLSNPAKEYKSALCHIFLSVHQQLPDDPYKLFPSHSIHQVLNYSYQIQRMVQ